MFKFKHLVPILPLMALVGITMIGPPTTLLFLASLVVMVAGVAAMSLLVPPPSRPFFAIAALLATALVLSDQALAQATTPAVVPQDTTVIIPWGSWLASALAYFKEIVIGVVVAVLGYLSRNLPASVVAVLEAARVEQLLKNAVDYGIGAVSNSVKDKTVSVDVTNEILHKAAEYAVTNAPALATKLGDTLMPKLLARMSAAGVVAPEASTDTTIQAAALPPSSVSVAEVITTPVASK